MGSLAELSSRKHRCQSMDLFALWLLGEAVIPDAYERVVSRLSLSSAKDRLAKSIREDVGGYPKRVFRRCRTRVPTPTPTGESVVGDGAGHRLGVGRGQPVAHRSNIDSRDGNPRLVVPPNRGGFLYAASRSGTAVFS
jgi:hypothetical protein